MAKSETMYTFVDLFAGAGGFAEGFLLAGEDKQFELLGSSDIRIVAKLTHEGRFKDQLGLNYSFLVEDIRSPDFVETFLNMIYQVHGEKKVDVVCGGPPCQGFALFGPRNQSDPRNDLFRPYLAFIEHVQPKYFIMENVPGLVLMYGGSVPEKIISAIESMKSVKYNVVGPVQIEASDWGVPQQRERVLFIGSRSDVEQIETITTEKAGKKITVEQAIADLSFLRPWESTSRYHPDYPASTKYQQESRRGRLFKKAGISRKDGILHNHEAAKHTPEVIARFAMIEEGKGLDSIPQQLWETHLQSAKKWCIRLDRSKPSNTIVTLPDDFVHYSQHRILTVREMARLQSFDDTFIFKGPRSTGGGGAGNKKRRVELPQYSQVGNAVPPLMAKAIAETVLRALQEEHT